MPLKTFVKASSVTNLADARYFAAAGAEWLGFCFDKESHKNISLKYAEEILNWVNGPKIVAEISQQNINEINELVEKLGMDFIQTSERFQSIAYSLITIPIIQEVILDKSFSEEKLRQMLSELQSRSAFFLLNFSQNKIDWKNICNKEFLSMEMLQAICKNYPVILDFDFNKENLLEIIDRLQPKGININAGTEIKTGVKDFASINDLFDLLQSET